MRLERYSTSVRMVGFKRAFALTIVLALMLVPAVGRAQRHVELPNAKPHLSAPYRSVDVRPVPVLAAPDTSSFIRIDDDKNGTRQRVDADTTSLPVAPDVSDRGTLRGPPHA
jgi:hypothetical protein